MLVSGSKGAFCPSLPSALLPMSVCTQPGCRAIKVNPSSLRSFAKTAVSAFQTEQRGRTRMDTCDCTCLNVLQESGNLLNSLEKVRKRPMHAKATIGSIHCHMQIVIVTPVMLSKSIATGCCCRRRRTHVDGSLAGVICKKHSSKVSTVVCRNGATD